MTTQRQSHKEKVKVTFECSADERAFIKMLSAKDHTTISGFILSLVRPYLPCEPNEETKKAMLDSRERKNLGHAENIDDFWKQMGINPHA